MGRAAPAGDPEPAGAPAEQQVERRGRTHLVGARDVGARSQQRAHAEVGELAA